MKIAICGGTLSGLTLSRLLGTRTTHSIDLHSALNDPARPIHRPHPLCEYGSLSFPIRDDAISSIQEEINLWNKRGHINIQSPERLQIFNAVTTSFQDLPSEGVTRFQPNSGFFKLIQSLKKELPSSVKIQEEQLAGMAKKIDGWHLQTIDNAASLGPYDLILFAYDASPRASRKASYKQLLERGLPESSSVISSLVRAVSASTMTVIVSFNPPLDTTFDSLRVEGIPELRFATRNSRDDAVLRGIKQKKGDDVWTLVATPEWSQNVRGSHKGKWNKQKVGQDIVSAFGKTVGRSDLVGCYRTVVPTFHWQGASLLTQLVDSELPFAFDPSTGLGFCGDNFGGQGVEGALKSSIAMAKHIKDSLDTPQLPNTKDAWKYREAQKYDDDTNSISGHCIGRNDPNDGFDHTWPTAVDIANGKDVQAADSMAKYRKRSGNGQRKKKGAPTPRRRNASKQPQSGKQS